MAAAGSLVPDQLKRAIHLAASNIGKFHKKQILPRKTVETMPGVQMLAKAGGH